MWELTYADSKSSVFVLDQKSAQCRLIQQIDGSWVARLEYENFAHIFRIYDSTTPEEAKNQLAQEVSDKLAGLSAIAAALRDFKIE